MSLGPPWSFDLAASTAFQTCRSKRSQIERTRPLSILSISTVGTGPTGVSVTKS